MSREKEAFAYTQMEVWKSHSEGHNLDQGKGMDPLPYMNECEYVGSVGDVFREYGRFQDIPDMEHLLAEAGITDYAKFLCGYHIHGEAAITHEGRYCALDWYFQDAAQRQKDYSMWDHFLILDQVSPTNFWKAKVVKIQEKQYKGWEEQRAGSSSEKV